jgi:16S rRNA (uracil1498-N3)-methyltransferase
MTTRRRFFLPRNFIRNGTATLTSGQAHHLRDVLRLKDGDAVELFNDCGEVYTGTVRLCRAQVQIGDLRRIAAEKTPGRLVLAVSLIKAVRFEWILQKSTELGVEEIIPLETRFCDIRIPPARLGPRMKRWERIVQEACKQCRRPALPRIRQPLPFRDFVSIGDYRSFSRVLFHERAEQDWRPDNLSSGQMILCTGPEGGWEDREVQLAEKAGFGIYRMGPWILRAETAALAAVSIAQYQILLGRNE